MNAVSEQFIIGKSFQLCSDTELGFSPRDGYQFKYWIDSSGLSYENHQTITINDLSFNISAEWEKIETIPSGLIHSEDVKEYNNSFDIWWMKI